MAWFIIGVTHVSAIVFLGLLSPLAKDFAFDVGELITTWLPVSSQALIKEKNSIYSFSKLPILLKEKKKIKTPQQPSDGVKPASSKVFCFMIHQKTRDCHVYTSPFVSFPQAKPLRILRRREAPHVPAQPPFHPSTTAHNHGHLQGRHEFPFHKSGDTGAESLKSSIL